MSTDTRDETSRTAGSWDAYWEGTGEIAAYSAGGARHPGVLAFWGDFFNTISGQFDSPTILDIASGNGAVVEYALSVLKGNCRIHCVDISESAIANIEKRFESVTGLVADARSIPLDSASFDVVTSQFGIEYAGLEAFDEAASLVADGGWLALLVHSREGQIFEQCTINLDAVTKVRESDFVGLAADMFAAGFQAVKGADREPYDRAAKKLAPAVQLIESVMTEYGEDVADVTVARLYSDVANIHSRIQYHDPDEVLSWLARMERELEAYAGRMASMCDAAMGEASFEQLCEKFEGQGFTMQTRGLLLPEDNEIPLAWAIIAKR